MLHKTVLPLLLLISFCTARSQYYGRTFHEIGIMGGPSFFQGDFGERGNFENTIKNVGFSGSLVYYLSMNVNRSSFAQNFKVRFDVSGMAVNLQHYGQYAEKESITGKQL